MWITVHGSAAADPTPNAQKAYREIKLGCMSGARPGLLIEGAPASTKEKPLMFLDGMPAGQQEASLMYAMMIMMTAMQCCRPERGPTIARFFLALASFVRKQRSLGASWAALSDFWRDLMKRADLRVDSFLLHLAADVGQLDPAWITDPTASYSAAYAVARAPEIARWAVQDAASNASANTSAAKTMEAQLDKMLKSRGFGKGAGKYERPGKEAGKGKAKLEKEASPTLKRDRNGESKTNAAGQLLLTNKKTNGGRSSGKSPASKEAYLRNGVFKVPMPETRQALLKEMGQWEDMDPCPFFFLSSKPCRDGDKCNMYH